MAARQYKASSWDWTKWVKWGNFFTYRKAEYKLSTKHGTVGYIFRLYRYQPNGPFLETTYKRVSDFYCVSGDLVDGKPNISPLCGVVWVQMPLRYNITLLTDYAGSQRIALMIVCILTCWLLCQFPLFVVLICPWQNVRFNVNNYLLLHCM